VLKRCAHVKQTLNLEMYLNTIWSRLIILIIHV